MLASDWYTQIHFFTIINDGLMCQVMISNYELTLHRIVDFGVKIVVL